MSGDTVTLALDGDVYLGDFAKAIQGLQSLISALEKEVARGANIEWGVDSLERSSAIATCRGVSASPEAVERVTEAYLAAGRAREQGSPVPFGEPVKTALGSIASIIDGRVRSIRLETADGEAILQSPESRASPVALRVAFGAVTGRIQTLSSRGGLRFTLYDLVNDKAISCYLGEGQEETLRGLWGSIAIVEGSVTRDAVTGRALAVRRVTRVVPKREVEAGSYRLAMGAVPKPPKADSPEVIIRRLRDA